MKRRSSEDAADADASETPSAGKRARATTATIAENPTGDDDVRGDARDARALAEEMRARHKKEAEEAWADAEARGVAVEGVENKHENPALEVIAN